jgi:dTDP-4-amino-4,6-dideoxygalactose transaminase
MTESVETFEYMIADFYGSKFAIATDCCTHALELCLRYTEVENVNCPNHTYLSVPMTFNKLNLNWTFFNKYWKDYYYIGNTNIIDAAVYWKQDGYVKDSFMCLSFQYKKHLNLGRGGMILTDDYKAALELRKTSYDGRLPNIPWAEQNIDTMGYHYYMTPETAELGIEKFDIVKDINPEGWSWKDYPDLKTMKVFDAK